MCSEANTDEPLSSVADLRVVYVVECHVVRVRSIDWGRDSDHNGQMIEG